MTTRHYDYPNAKSVVICGDIHGEFEKLVYQCCVRYELRDLIERGHRIEIERFLKSFNKETK